MKLHNKYYILRHGEAVSNVRRITSSWPETFNNHLTTKGKKMIKEAVLTLKSKNINLIFMSPLKRTRQTAEIVSKALNIKPKVDKRLQEIGFGIFNGDEMEKMWMSFKNEEKRIEMGPPEGESYAQILARMLDFLRDTDEKYKGKHILIISHEGPLFLLQGKVMGLTIKETIKQFPLEKRIHKGEIRELN